MTTTRKYLLVFIVCAITAILVGVTRTGYAQDSAAGKIAPWVLEHTANNESAEFLVVLTEQANLNAAAQLPNKEAKGSYVYTTLYRTAQTTQAPILAWLKDRGIEHRSYYIVNLIWVKADRETALALAARSDVARLVGNPEIRVIELQPIGPTAPDQAEAPAGIEQGITYVRAPEVWAMGYTGQGIVVGGQDTGIQWDHPALKNHYRGWNTTTLTVTHDYNWHDSVHSGGGTCGANSPVPCDDHGHGTHTVGTAVGDDGATNRIGMAPGAKFIGCRNMNVGVGSPATYLECFEFFLAPYPVGGTPAQGDPSKAPDVTNNSWGCPTDEGCDMNSLTLAVQAQRAAGIMTVVSAGNSGPSCSTVTDPPSYYDEVYSVGNINAATGLISSSSSRGPVTADSSGRLKPDITAPGTSVRSAYPTNTYTSMSGTSMAGPHVAGAVALLWSARPALKNNLALTEQTLNNSAVHVNNSTCDTAGTTWPNNTYGYGRLDIKNAVDLTPAGNSYLIGSVTDANTAAPIAGATVTANATVTQTGSTTTVSTGQYSLILMANTYTVTAAAYGYQPAQLTGITVATNTTTTQNISLTPASSYIVSGTVRDALTSLPLTGSITIAGYPFGPVSTNPASGFYSVTLAAGNVYTFTVASLGYGSAVRTVGPLTADRTEDFALNADLLACNAPGYQFYGLNQPFNATVVPTGWLVINNVGTQGWSFNDPGARGNLTGGAGGFAIADSDNAGSGVSMDTELRTPVIDLSAQPQVTLTFKTDFHSYSGGQTEVADVDVSVNGAAGPWTNVWRKTADNRGPKTETVDLSTMAGGQANAMLRFHYYNAVWEYWWQVDDVQLGRCQLQTTQLNLPILTPIVSAQSGNPGAVLTYHLNLTNTDTVSHTFDVQITGNAWPMNTVPPIGPVAAHGAQSFTATVTVPNPILAYTADAAHVTVSAQASPVLSATTRLTTTASFVPGIDLTPTQLAQTGSASEWITYTLDLSNTGNFTDTFSLDYINNLWPVQGPLSITLPAWSNTPLLVAVHVPATATTGLSDTAHLTATGTGVFAFSDLTTTARHDYAVFLPLIRQD